MARNLRCDSIQFLLADSLRNKVRTQLQGYAIQFFFDRQTERSIWGNLDGSRVIQWDK
jgi:hypothetical protein